MQMSTVKVREVQECILDDQLNIVDIAQWWEVNGEKFPSSEAAMRAVGHIFDQRKEDPDGV